MKNKRNTGKSASRPAKSKTDSPRRTRRSRAQSAPPWHARLPVREWALLAMLVAAIYLFASLISFSPEDSAWSHVSDTLPVYNTGGVIGAWFADVVLFFFGYVAFFIPLYAAYLAWQLLKDELDSERTHFTFGRVFAGTGVLIAGCILGSLHVPSTPGSLPAGVGAGGMLGELLAQSMLPGLNRFGTTLLSGAIFVAALSTATGVSLLQVLERIGSRAMQIAQWMSAGVGLVWGQGREALIARMEQWEDNDEYHDEHDSHGSKRGLESRRDRTLASPAIGKLPTEPQLGTMPPPAHSEPALGLGDDGDMPDIPILKAVTESRAKAPLSAQRVKQGQRDIFTQTDAGVLPPTSLLDAPKPSKAGYSDAELAQLSQLLETKFKDFGVTVQVVAVHPGPVVTRFEMQPAAGVKSSQILNLAKDIARSLSVMSVRVVEVIPGKTTVGIEIPNVHREIVSLQEVIESAAYRDSTSALTIAMGKDIAGRAICSDLSKMPHLLVAGTTGSGKSVAVNAMLVSLLYKATPQQCRLILIDPKMLELNVYEGIGHLLTPVVTDMKEAANALRWSVGEMERRYKLMATLGVRNIGGYNKKIADAVAAGEPLLDPFWEPQPDTLHPELTPLPYIVIVVDEFADMMMVVGKKVEELIARIAQKARAAGLHLILATQRPSVDVITGLIKANIPTRMAFQVSSKIDSRTIIDQMGAEQLLGHGDMLFVPPGTSATERVHGAFVDDHEVHAVVAYLKRQGGAQYDPNIVQEEHEVVGIPADREESEGDVLYDEAVAIVTESRKASISYVQRRLKIGYNRAARMIEDMEAAGVVSAVLSNGQREVIAPPPVSD